MRIISERIPTVRSISIGLWVDVGSRDEPQGMEGISHFIEHMVFKGTANRSAFDIVSYIESVGGILNAFTTRENTCFLTKIIDTQLPRAVEILSDLVFNANFDPKELVKEKKIVIDEINEVEDTPADLVHDYFAESIFGKHPLGRPILGYRKTVRAFDRDKVIGYLKNNYLRKKMIVVACGNLDHDELVKLVKKYIPIGIDKRNNGYPQYKRIKRTAPGLQPGTISFNRKTAQTHICIGMPAMNFSHKNRAAMLLLNSLMGGGMSSRLFQRIREEMGLAYTIFSYLDFFKDASIVGVYINTEKNHAETVTAAVFEEFEKLKKEKLSVTELDATKEQAKGSLVLGLENTSHRMNRLAKHELLLRKYVTIDETIAQIDRVTPKILRNIANNIFIPEKYNVTILGPIGKKIKAISA